MSIATNWQSKIYSRFRGVDFSTDATNIDESRASDMLNMIADEAGFPSKRVGWRILTDANSGRINGLHYLSLLQGYGILFIHAGTKLQTELGGKVEHIDRMPDEDKALMQKVVERLESYRSESADE